VSATGLWAVVAALAVVLGLTALTPTRPLGALHAVALPA